AFDGDPYRLSLTSAAPVFQMFCDEQAANARSRPRQYPTVLLSDILSEILSWALECAFYSRVDSIPDSSGTASKTNTLDGVSRRHSKAHYAASGFPALPFGAGRGWLLGPAITDIKHAQIRGRPDVSRRRLASICISDRPC